MNSIAEHPLKTASATASAGAPLRGTLAALSLSVLLSSLGTSIANVGLPALAHAFAASFQAVQWVVLAYLLAITTLIVGAGRLGDMVGRRRLLLVGIVIFTAASILCGFAPTLGLLIAARAVQGFGAAVMMTLALAFVGDAVPKEKNGVAMGMLGTMSAIGTALGPSLGGLLIGACGWRAMFLVNVPLGLVAYLLARRFLPADSAQSERERNPFDVRGTLLLALTLTAYALAMTLGRGRFGFINLGLSAAALMGLALFVRFEAKIASPLVRVSMLRDAGLSAGLSMSALVSTVLMATLVVGPFYLSRALGLQAGEVGVVLSIGPLVAAFTGVPAGRWVDRWGASRVTIMGLVAASAGCVLLSLLPLELGVGGYVAAMVVLTAGYAVFQTANNAAVMSDLPTGERGVVAGLLNLSRHLGLITGASMMGAVFAFAGGTNETGATPPDSVAAGMRATFVLAAALVFIALGIAARSRPALWRSPASRVPLP